MRLIYENERGKVVMNGGNGEGFNIIEIKGLSLPENDIEAVYFPNSPGRKVQNVTPLERAITISGDICDKTNQKLARAVNVLSVPGRIIINSNGRVRKIDARCVSFEPNKRRGAYVPFAVQFIADDPYFTDMNETLINVFKREGKVSSEFVLPCVFSKRKTEAEIINRGDGTIEPIFEISSVSGAVCPEGISIKNTTNGNEIKLMCDVLAGEVITVDVKKRKITSNLRGNLIFLMADETSISRFFLDTDISTVTIYAKDLEGTFHATCRYLNRYLYALI